MTDEAIGAWRARVELERGLARLLFMRLVAAAGACVVYGVGVGILAQDVDAGVAALTGLSAVSGGSIAAGLLAALSAPRPARRAVAAVWLKHLWVLHLPWLVIGPGAILVAALAIVGRAAPGVAPLVLLVAMALGPIWLMLSGLCIVVWGQRRQVDIQVLQLRAPTVHIAMMLCAIATLAAAIVLGFVGGSVAVLGPLTADVMPGEEF